MKKTVLITTLTFNLLLFTFNLKAQPTIQWEKSYGSSWLEFARSVQQTSDKGFILVGASQFADVDVSVNYGSNDYWVVKTDSLGNLEWEKSYGGSEADNAESVQQTTDGGYVVIGNSKSNDVDVAGHHGNTFNNDIWLIKLDAIGNIQWEKSYGGNAEETVRYIQETTDGGYVFTGKSSGVDGDVTTTNGGNSDYWVVKIDSSGNIQWQDSFGGNGDDEAYSVRETQNGNYIVVGVSNSANGDVSNPKGSYDYWVIMLDNLGNIQWEKSYGGTGGDDANSVRQTADGGFVIVGESISSDGDVTVNPMGVWLIKIDNNGGLLWQRGFSVGISWQAADVLEIASDGGFLIASGVTNSSNDINIIKTDSLGNLDWQKVMGGSATDEPVAFREAADGGYFILGISDSFNGDISTPIGSQDYWLVKLNAVVGVEEVKNSDGVLVYPNPSTGIFNLNTNAEVRYVEVVNLLGNSVLKKVIKSKQTVIDLKQHAKGIYFIKLFIDNKVVTKKIIYQP